MPWDQINATPIAAGFAAYQSANPSDSLVYLINLGYSLSGAQDGDLYTSANILEHSSYEYHVDMPPSAPRRGVTAAISSSVGGYSAF